jgi:tetratricopeptide (TPR) repeat protein
MRGLQQISRCVFLALCLCVPLAHSAQGQTAHENEYRHLVQEGFALHQQAKYTEAIPLFEKARVLEPDDYFANILLGIDLVKTGEAAQAVPYLKAAARANPKEEMPEEFLGEAYAKLGNFARAATAFIEAMKRGNDSEQSLLAWAGFGLERFRQIGKELRSTPSGLVAVRELQQESSKPVSSLKCSGPIPALEERLAALRGSANAGIGLRHALSVCYAIEANHAAEHLSTSAQDQAALHQLRGNVLLRLSNDAKGAAEEYKQAIALRPNDPTLYDRLAEAEMSAGNQEVARTSSLAALQLDPHQLSAMGTLATLDMNNRDYENALPWLEKMRAESPMDRDVQVQLAKAQAETGKPAEALANLREALAEGYPDEKGALHSLEARMLRKLGRNNEAKQAAEEAKRLSNAFQEHAQSGTTGRSNAVQ